MSLITTEMLKANYDPKISMPMSQYAKAIVDTRNETVDEVLEIIDKYAGHDGSDDYCDGYDVACLDIKQEVLALKGGDDNDKS